MKKLVLGSLMAVLVSQAAGCIITSGGGDDDATITANWTLRNLASNQAIPCPPGTTTAAVYSQAVNASNQPVGSAIIDLFDCDDNTGRTAPLPPDVYQVWVELTSEGGGSVYASSTKWPAGLPDADRNDIVDVRDVDQSISATLLEDGGYFALSWDLVDSQTTAPLTCAEALADGVGVISTSASNSSMFTDDKFNCEAGFGITGGLLQGAYQVSIDAFEDGAGGLGTPVVLTNETIRGQNDITDLGLVMIPID